MSAATTRTKIVTLPINEIKETFFVRKELSEDRVLQLAMLYEAGTELPPLRVADGTNELIFGRHRRAALELLNRSEARCEIVKPESRAEMIVMAIEENVGGPLPLTRADIEHSIKLLLAEKTPRTQIVKMVTCWPPAVTRRYLNNVQAAMGKEKMLKAVTAVVDGGLNVPQAAEQFSVDSEDLRQELSGEKKRRKKFGLSELKSGLTSQFKSNSLKSAALVKRLLEGYEDGEVAETQVHEVLSHISHLNRRAQRSHQDWVNRFEALANSKNGNN